MNWVQRIKVQGSQGDPYIVGVTDTGKWGCSCPAWRFKKSIDGERPPCKHIDAVRAAIASAPPALPNHGPRVVELDDHASRRKMPKLTFGSRFRHLDLELTVI